MIISHKYQFIFLKTRKTAGTSIELALSRYCGCADVITRMSPEDEAFRQECGGRDPQNVDVPRRHYTLRDWVRLAIRRRPAYPFAEHGNATMIRQYIGRNTFSNYFKFCVERNPWDKVISYWHYRGGAGGLTLRQFIMSKDLIRRSDWERYTQDGDVLMDQVIRYEDLRTELTGVCARLGIPWDSNMPRAKGHFRTDRRPHWEVLEDDERARIAEVFSREIAHFGYVFGPTDVR
jgi:hypothetical protein